MKTEIRKIKEGLFRTCYDMGRGETTVPFETYAEAEAFERGLEHAVREAESVARKEAWKRRDILSNSH